LLINPVRGFLVLGIIYFLWRVDGGLEVFKEATSLLAFAVEEYVVSIIRTKIDS